MYTHKHTPQHETTQSPRASVRVQQFKPFPIFSAQASSTSTNTQRIKYALWYLCCVFICRWIMDRNIPPRPFVFQTLLRSCFQAEQHCGNGSLQQAEHLQLPTLSTDSIVRACHRSPHALLFSGGYLTDTWQCTLRAGRDRTLRKALHSRLHCPPGLRCGITKVLFDRR